MHPNLVKVTKLQSSFNACVLEGLSYGYLSAQAKMFFEALFGSDVSIISINNELIASENIKDSTSVDAARFAVRYIQKTSLSNTKQVLIFPKADLMTNQAQSVLLKSLEEPQKNNVIVLLVKNINSLLPTIISRVIKINLNIDCNVLNRNKLTEKELKEKSVLEKLVNDLREFSSYVSFLEYLKNNKSDINKIIYLLLEICNEKIVSLDSIYKSKIYTDMITMLPKLNFKLRQNKMFNILISEFVVQLWENNVRGNDENCRC